MGGPQEHYTDWKTQDAKDTFCRVLPDGNFLICKTNLLVRLVVASGGGIEYKDVVTGEFRDSITYTACWDWSYKVALISKTYFTKPIYWM